MSVSGVTFTPNENEKVESDEEDEGNLELAPEIAAVIGHDYIPHRVFLNNVDTFNARYITEYLTDQQYGASKLMRARDGDEAPVEEAPVEPLTSAFPLENYELIGMLTLPFNKKTEDILYTIDDNDMEKFGDEIMKCQFIVYDITRRPQEINKALNTLALIESRFDKIKEIGPKTYEKYDKTKVFILISTALTWARTKPLDRNDPSLAFTELDYRKRRSHPNYKEHFNCEKDIIKRGENHKGKLKTYVVCSGITYGEEEQDLEFFFKMAWYNEILPIINGGANIIPLIHIKDLAKVLHGLMETVPPKPQYILAVEQTASTLKAIIKALSKAMGPGRTVNITNGEIFLYPNMTQQLFDLFTINVNMEPVFIVENLQIEWKNEANLVENMKEIVQEFREARNLKPVKIILHGPPGVGKTRLAKRLCEYYGAHYVSTETLIEETLKDLKEILAVKETEAKEKSEEVKGEDELGEEEDVEDDEEDAAAIKEQIREIETLMEAESPVPDNYVIELLRSFLNKNLCQNRGYVIDGYPIITEQAKELFGQAAEGGEEEEVELAPGPSKIIPDYVISLDATDDFICNRIMALPEDHIQGSIYEEDKMLTRLEEYRINNNEDNTVLNYFDELEVEIMPLNAMTDASPNLDLLFKSVTLKVGLPSTFGLTNEEKEELHRIEEMEQKLAEEKTTIAKKLAEEREAQVHKDKMEEWASTLEKLQMEEEKILIAESEPLRHYLMKFVFPVLTKGLIELVKLKPQDPVDFLAEYLFKENPEGRMFGPSYCAEGENLYDEFKKELEAIINTNEAFGK